MRDPYTSGSSTTNFYPSGSLRTEPNMREEFNNTLAGNLPEIAKGQTGLLRSMSTTLCPCVSDITQEPDKDIWCPICWGMGYYWDEQYLSFYKTLEKTDPSNASTSQTDIGLISSDTVVFYVRYDEVINEDDRIIELQLDDDGSVSSPETRVSVYRIAKIWKYRADAAKLEYQKVFTYKEIVKHLNPPGYGEG